MLFKTVLYTTVTLLVLSSSLTNATPATPLPLHSKSYSLTTAKPQTIVVGPNAKTVVVARDSFTATSEADLAVIVAAKAAADEQARIAAEAAAEVATKAAEAEANKAKAATAPNFTPNPGSAQSYAQGAVAARGWGSGEFNCLVSLWNKESGWRANASNPSGAYGIPQALPGSKMSSAGADWAINANTQIEWGLGYITSRYGTPCSAWATSQSKGWY